MNITLRDMLNIPKKFFSYGIGKLRSVTTSQILITYHIILFKQVCHILAENNVPEISILSDIFF